MTESIRRTQGEIVVLDEEKSAQQESAMASPGPGILAPEEFLPTLQRTVPLEAEKRLLLAVLKDALYCRLPMSWASAC